MEFRMYFLLNSHSQSCIRCSKYERIGTKDTQRYLSSSALSL